MNKKAFTILEILVVISVIAILIGIAVPRFKGMQDAANIIKAKSEMKTIQSAMESWKNNHTTYPSAVTTLETATPQIINAGMLNPLTSAAYQIDNSPDASLYYVIYAPLTAGKTIQIADTGIISNNSGTTLEVYCVTNGTFNCNN
ncbi:MAG: prepilin-type N-terminal cleavage/methylation domain-containing protein [Candidatus Omnitrophota bacterium]